MVQLLKKLILGGSFGSLLCGYCLFRELPMPSATGPAYQLLQKQSFPQHPNQHFLTKEPHSIGIIGGGPAGLITAKVLSQQGYQVEVLEKSERTGGVWAENYENAGLQGTFPHFQIPDFPWVEGTPLFPKLPQVREYLDSFVDFFHLKPLISLGSEVTSVQQEKDGSWTVSLQTGVKRQYDFLVLSTGQYSSPYVPAVAGLDSFQGQALHSFYVRNAKELFTEKRVVVVGGGKSACDILTLAAENSSNVTGVMSEPLWSGSRTKLFYGREIQAWLTCRLAGILNPAPYEANTWFNWLFRQIGNLYWGGIAFRLTEDLPNCLKPNSDLRIPRAIIGRDEALVSRIAKGEVAIVKGPISHITPQGLIVNSVLIPADVIVFATGFQCITFGLAKKEQTFWLYRGILDPKVSNFAVIGYGNLTFTQLKSSLQASWLCDVLRGAVQLPSLETMKAEVQAYEAVIREAYGAKACKLAYIWNEVRYYDALLRDMQVQIRRKRTLYEDLLGMSDPLDYKLILTHRV